MTTRPRTHTRKSRSPSRQGSEQRSALDFEANQNDRSQLARAKEELGRAKEEFGKLIRRTIRVAANPHHAQHQERRHS